MYKPRDPLLDLILQKYIQSSRDSIHGPVALKTDKKLVSLNKGTEQKLMMKFDVIPDESKLGAANLDGHSVSGFIVGGEKRLCFTEIAHTVLKDVNVQEIIKKRDNLLIFTSKCSQKQLDELKYHEVLPWTTTSSNLMTISDAFRLIGALQCNLAIKVDPVKRSSSAFEVYHECFGGCIGLLDPDMYSAVNAPCIRCTECNGLFSTKKFVSHNHSNYDEVHTCHWGFDSSNWRIYIMLVEQHPTQDHVTLWQSVRAKYTRNHHSTLEKTDAKGQDADFMAYINSPDNKKELVSPIENHRTKQAASSASASSGSAFRPWSPSNSSSRFSKCYDKFTFPSSKHGESRDNYPTSPVYLNCKQCNSASHALCSGKHTRREKEIHVSCSCNECKNSVEGSLEKILQTFTSQDNRLTTEPRDLAKILTDELKKLSLTNDERVQQISISNQRLQTELQLVKIESSKRLAEVRDSKAHVEQELEMLHRERQKVSKSYSLLFNCEFQTV